MDAWRRNEQVHRAIRNHRAQSFCGFDDVARRVGDIIIRYGTVLVDLISPSTIYIILKAWGQGW